MELNIFFWTLGSCYHVPLKTTELLLRLKHKANIVLYVCVSVCVFVYVLGVKYQVKSHDVAGEKRF